MNPTVKYYHADHFKNGQNGKGLACFAYLIDPESLFVSVGIAFCHPDDNYSKEIGRKLAEEALEDQPIVLSMEGLVHCFKKAKTYDLHAEPMMKAMILNGLGMYLSEYELAPHENKAIEELNFSGFMETLRYDVSHVARISIQEEKEKNANPS